MVQLIYSSQFIILMLAFIKEKEKILGGLALVIGATITYFLYKKSREIPKVGILDLVGNTPLVYLPKLSKAANCLIYVLR